MTTSLQGSLSTSQSMGISCAILSLAQARITFHSANSTDGTQTVCYRGPDWLPANTILLRNKMEYTHAMKKLFHPWSLTFSLPEVHSIQPSPLLCQSQHHNPAQCKSNNNIIRIIAHLPWSCPKVSNKWVLHPSLLQAYPDGFSSYG